MPLDHEHKLVKVGPVPPGPLMLGIPNVPEYYWNAYSSDQLWRFLCRNVGDMAKYANDLHDVDVDLQKQITTETNTRISEDAKLQTQIDNFDSDVAALRAAIASESATRKSTDDYLQNQIDTANGEISAIDADLAQEISTRKSEDGKLQTQIDALVKLFPLNFKGAVAFTIPEKTYPANSDADYTFTNAEGWKDPQLSPLNIQAFSQTTYPISAYPLNKISSSSYGYHVRNESDNDYAASLTFFLMSIG